jgi:hypothetical protein
MQHPVCLLSIVGPCHVVGLEWYTGTHGYTDPSCPVLAICLDNGRMQLMRHDMDDNAVCIDTGIRPNNIKWNHNGSVSVHMCQLQHWPWALAVCTGLATCVCAPFGGLRA